MKTGTVIDEQIDGGERPVATGAAADLALRLQHGDVYAVACQSKCSGKPVRAAAHYRRGSRHDVDSPAPAVADDVSGAECRAVVESARRRHVTDMGMGPSGSHGWADTASSTFHVPVSITPRAASMSLYDCVFRWMGCDSTHATTNSPGSKLQRR